MKTSSIYKGLDLRTATVGDVASLFSDKPPIYISPEKELTDEEQRILELVCFAENYEIPDLANLLNRIFKEQLLSINQ